MGALTFTPSVPSDTSIFPMRLSSTASNSIVALSVSISARMSPDLNRIAFLHQPFGELALFIVGDSVGHEDVGRHYLPPEVGKLSKWCEGRRCGQVGRILAEIETDKATMEFEAVDEGRIGKILVSEGTEGVKVNAPIATLIGEDGDAAATGVPDISTAMARSRKLSRQRRKTRRSPRFPRRRRKRRNRRRR